MSDTNSFVFCFQDSELNELRATIEALKRQSSLNIPEILISPNAPQKHSTPVTHSAKDQHLHVNGKYSCGYALVSPVPV